MVDALYSRYERDPNVVARDIGGEKILVPVRKKTADMAAIFVLNETSALIWNSLDGQRTLFDIRDALVKAYDVAPEVAGDDVLETIGQLEEAGVVRLAADALS